MVGELARHMQNNEIKSLTPNRKIGSIWLMTLDIRSKTVNTEKKIWKIHSYPKDWKYA